MAVKATAEFALAHNVKRLTITAGLCVIDGLTFRAKGNICAFAFYEIVVGGLG